MERFVGIVHIIGPEQGFTVSIECVAHDLVFDVECRISFLGLHACVATLTLQVSS